MRKCSNVFQNKRAGGRATKTHPDYCSQVHFTVNHKPTHLVANTLLVKMLGRIEWRKYFTPTHEKRKEAGIFSAAATWLSKMGRKINFFGHTSAGVL